MNHKTEQSLNNVHLAFVTDGDPYQILGIACIIHAFLSEFGAEGFRYPIWIITSEPQSINTLNYFLPDFAELDFREFIVEASLGDKYFIQIGLAKLFEILDQDHTLISLDYDHIVFHPERFPFYALPANIMVSSEVSYSISLDTQYSSLKTIENSILPSKHMNASIIYGRVADLCKIGSLWFQAYKDLIPLVSPRHRVEIALTLAAERAELLLTPCSAFIQANFSVPYDNSCLFHYGGDSSAAKHMKNKLLNFSKQIYRTEEKKDKLHSIRTHLKRELIKLIKTSFM